MSGNKKKPDTGFNIPHLVNSSNMFHQDVTLGVV